MWGWIESSVTAFQPEQLSFADTFLRSSSNDIPSSNRNTGICNSHCHQTQVRLQHWLCKSQRNKPRGSCSYFFGAMVTDSVASLLQLSKSYLMTVYQILNILRVFWSRTAQRWTNDIWFFLMMEYWICNELSFKLVLNTYVLLNPCQYSVYSLVYSGSKRTWL